MSSIFVGNLSFKTTTADLTDLFSEFGEVQCCKIVTDNENRSRGFGFVDMDQDEAEHAIAEMDGKRFMGRDLNVSPAKIREQRHRKGHSNH